MIGAAILFGAVVLFADDFARSRLGDPRSYLLKDGYCGPAAAKPEVAVRDGALSFRTAGSREARLNIMAQAGERFTLDARFSWTQGPRLSAGFSFCDDYRIAECLYLGFRSKESEVELTGAGLSLKHPLAVERGRSYLVHIERASRHVKVAVDGATLFDVDVPVPPSRKAYEDDPLAHGGFALRARGIEDDATFEVRSLRIEGEPAARPKRAIALPLERLGPGGSARVYFYPGHEAWAVKLLEGVPRWLADIEAILGVPPCSREIEVNEQDEPYYDLGAGFNEWGTILIGTRMGDFGPNHEEYHCWQHLFKGAWANEGSADFFMFLWLERARGEPLLAHRVAGDLEAIRKADVDWSFPLEKDASCALGADGRPTPMMSRFHEKARTFCYILYRELGPKGFRSILERATKEGRRLGGETWRRYGEALTGKDMAPVFAGWIQPGEGKYRISEVASDRDHDGLSDLDERLLGTDPLKPDTDGDGLSDAFEVTHGLDPLDPKDAAPFRAKMADPIAVDGLANDWAAIPALLAETPGKAPIGGVAIGDVRALPSRDGRTLFLLVELGERKRDDFTVEVDLDVDFDRVADYRVALHPEMQRGDLFDLASGKPQRVRGLRRIEVMAGPGALEAAIPMDGLGFPDTVNVRVALVADGHAHAAQAGASRAVRLALPARDLDGDGYADFWERRNGFDPAHGRPPTGIAIDGCDGDWRDVPVAATRKPMERAGGSLWRELRAVATSTTLFALVTLEGAPPPDLTVQLDIDPGGEGRFDRRVLVFLGTGVADVLERGGDGKMTFGQKGREIRFAVAGTRSLELSVPLALLGSPRSLGLRATVLSKGVAASGHEPATVKLAVPGG